MLIKRILLVDDEKCILDTYSLLLAENGYTVVTTNCGNKALEQFFRQSFDLVITDLSMHDGDGFRLIEAIRERSPKNPIIAFTGNGGYRSVKEFLSLLGTNALIEKSCSNEKYLFPVLGIP
jgi:CheY-like chemotaxis protein